MNLMWAWLSEGSHWTGPDGVWTRVGQHLTYSALALAIGLVIAVPLGLAVGHTGRGRFWAVNLTGALRALPSLGLLYLAVLWAGPRFQGDNAYLVPAELVLVALAVPPILAGTYAGVEQVDPAARDAARGMGMTGWQVLWRVEVPCALALMFSGVRSAVLQVVSTATLAAAVSLGGLGRFLIDGLAVQDYGQMAGGALLVAALALTCDMVLAGVQRVVVSPGLTGRTPRGATVGTSPTSSEDSLHL